MSPLPPSANPTTGKTHVAEKDKYHEGGSLKAYSHEELGTDNDVRIVSYCIDAVDDGTVTVTVTVTVELFVLRCLFFFYRRTPT